MHHSTFLLPSMITALLLTGLLLATTPWPPPGASSTSSVPQGPPIRAQDANPYTVADIIAETRKALTTPAPHPWHGLCPEHAATTVNGFRAQVESRPDLRAFYADFQWTQAQVFRQPSEAFLYVSYRSASTGIVWTTHPLRIGQGETLITDGVRTVRTYCCNEISESPPPPGQPPTPPREYLEPPPPESPGFPPLAPPVPPIGLVPPPPSFFTPPPPGGDIPPSPPGSDVPPSPDTFVPPLPPSSLVPPPPLLAFLPPWNGSELLPPSTTAVSPSEQPPVIEETTPVPECQTLVLLGTGILSLVVMTFVTMAKQA